MPRPNRGPFLKFLRGRGSYYVCWYEGGSLRKRSAGTAISSDRCGGTSDFTTRSCIGINRRCICGFYWSCTSGSSNSNGIGIGQ